MLHGAKNILISGKPRVGKSTLIEAVVREFKDRAGGFITKEVRKNGERAGFEIVTLDGARGLLAERGLESPIRVGKYGVSTDALERIGVPAIERALHEKEVVVIDEIGNMEMVSGKFCDAVLRALESNRVVIGTIHAHEDPFTDRIKMRPDIEVVYLTIENRDEVKRGILEKIREFLL